MKSTNKGAFAIFLATIFYGLVGVMLRYVDEGFDLFNQVWSRNIIFLGVLGF